MKRNETELSKKKQDEEKKKNFVSFLEFLLNQSLFSKFSSLLLLLIYVYIPFFLPGFVYNKLLPNKKYAIICAIIIFCAELTLFQIFSHLISKKVSKIADSAVLPEAPSNRNKHGRKMKKLILSLAIVFLFIIAFLLWFGRAIPSCVKLSDADLNETFALQMNKNLFYRQTVNNCGPYSVMAVINILHTEERDPELLSEKMGWRMYKNLTFPQGVVNLLRDNGIKTKEVVLKSKSDRDKVRWIKQTVSEEKPIIVLIKVHHVLHYVTILGYDEKGFMLYDSMQEKSPESPRKTIVDERCTEGNRYYSYEDFISLWNAGGYKLFFRNWAIVCG